MFLVAYDVAANSPSGRRITSASEGLDVYEIGTGEKAELKRIAHALPLGGIDQTLFDVGVADAHVVCSQSGCAALRADAAGGGPRIEVLPGLPADAKRRQLIELAGDGSAAWGLYQGDYDDRLAAPPVATEPHFSVCSIGATPACRDLPATDIPFGLSVRKGEPHWETARTRQDLVRMLERDLARNRGTGIANFAENNLEGRIAWSAVYHLNGLVTLATDRAGLGSLLPAAELARLKDKATARLCFELTHHRTWAASRYPWYWTKRYSLDREPLASVLHLARIGRLLSRAQAVVGADAVAAPLAEATAELVAPSRAFEVIRDGANGRRAELRFGKYMPFWADGLNAPWNYQSGWIEGLVTTGALSRNKAVRAAAERMIAHFVADEGLSSRPRSWRYSAGDVFNGWSAEQGLSANTPSWAGDRTNTTAAHISYRSMDAMALLAAGRAGFPAVPADAVAYIGGLVEQGALYPFVAEELVLAGAVPRLPPALARWYARSALPWQVQNQIWAIAALAQTLHE